MSRQAATLSPDEERERQRRFDQANLARRRAERTIRVEIAANGYRVHDPATTEDYVYPERSAVHQHLDDFLDRVEAARSAQR